MKLLRMTYPHESNINPLKTESMCYISNQSVPRCKHSPPRLK